MKPNQTDQDTLPPYPELDGFLEEYLEGREAFKTLEKRHSKARAAEIVRRVEFNEFKRRQGAPVLKVTAKAFGIGRRIPITKTWDAR